MSEPIIDVPTTHKLTGKIKSQEPLEMIEPKPCPFCGSDKHITTVQIIDASKPYGGFCPKCEATGPTSVSIKGAIRLWDQALRK